MEGQGKAPEVPPGISLLDAESKALAARAAFTARVAHAARVANDGYRVLRMSRTLYPVFDAAERAGLRAIMYIQLACEPETPAEGFILDTSKNRAGIFPPSIAELVERELLGYIVGEEIPVVICIMSADRAAGVDCQRFIRSVFVAKTGFQAGSVPAQLEPQSSSAPSAATAPPAAATALPSAPSAATALPAPSAPSVAKKAGAAPAAKKAGTVPVAKKAGTVSAAKKTGAVPVAKKTGAASASPPGTEPKVPSPAEMDDYLSDLLGEDS